MTARLPVFFGGIAVGFGLTYAGGLLFLSLVTAAWIGLILETSVAASRSMGLPFRKYLWIDIIFFGAVPLVARTGGLPALALAGLSWFLILFLFFPTTRTGLTRWLFSTAVQPYLALGVYSFYLLRAEGWIWPACALAVVAVADTAAYLIGGAFGRHVLAPTISPAKTVEGAAGGIVLATATAAAILTTQGVPVQTAAAAGLGLSVLAVFGDLLESFLKRGLEIKDFGTILPGHGGLFDRLDSLLPVSAGLLLFLKLS